MPKSNIAVQAEIQNILEMLRCLQTSFADMGKPPSISEQDLYFWGFDGHPAEVRYLAHVRKLWKAGVLAGLGITDFAQKERLNSHFPTLETYGRMLKKWQEFDRNSELTEQQIEAIIAETIHPSRRPK